MKFILSLLFISLLSLSIFAQAQNLGIRQIIKSRGEAYFKFKVEPERLNKLTKIISIDKYSDGWCYAYANEKEFSNFEKMQLTPELVSEYYEAQRAVNLEMANTLSEMFSWNRYPTYAVYVEMMRNFAYTYPDICKLDTIGFSYSGKLLLAVKISDNVNVDEKEPEFLYGGQIHGDELVSGMALLKLIDTILRQYGTNTEITSLVDNLEIFINPILNPEGAYIVSDDNVKFATRYSRIGSKFYDINRNFPDALEGDHPDGEDSYSYETVALMNYVDNHNFVMSANLHSGAELVNYPYDTEESLPADNEWWTLVSADYAETVREMSDTAPYFRDFENGYTNGYAWYRITGSRQDYMNYFKNCREFTLELSIDKLLSTDTLAAYLRYNEPALLGYLKQSTYGLRGVVTDSITGDPLQAAVYINGFDSFNSHVYSFPEYGDYYRYLYEGSYDVTFSAPGYQSKTIRVFIENEEQTVLDVQLVRDEECSSSNCFANFNIYPNPATDVLKIDTEFQIPVVEIFDICGNLVGCEHNCSREIKVKELIPGVYFLRLTLNKKTYNYKFVKK